MLLNNGGTLSLYALKKKNPTKILEQITKSKGNVTYKRKILFKELFIIHVTKIKVKNVATQCLLTNI